MISQVICMDPRGERKMTKLTQHDAVYLSILSLCFCKRRRLSFSICLMRFSMSKRLSSAPSLVTSMIFFSDFSLATFPSSRWSKTDVLTRSRVGNLSIAAQVNSCTSSSSALVEPTLELLRKLDAAILNDDLMLLSISANSTLRVSLSFLPGWSISSSWVFGRRQWLLCHFKCMVFAIQLIWMWWLHFQLKEVHRGASTHSLCIRLIL